MEKPVLVIKFGTASITRPDGSLDEATLFRIARQVADIKDAYRIVLVSSGAVGAGRHAIPGFKGELTQKKAAAAVGNPILMGVYARAFAEMGIRVAQSLCERSHFAQRAPFLQLKQTYETLWASGVVPIANENDVVSDVELKFSDNDELATLLAAGLGAETLMFSTSVGGLLDKSGQRIPSVPRIDESVWSLVDTSKSSLGLGGMLSKLSFTQRALSLGIQVVIFSAREENAIPEALAGRAGTVFRPSAKGKRSLRQKWLGTGSLIAGRIHLDAGAAEAILKRKSLLAVGIVSVEGSFRAGEVVELLQPGPLCIAVARCRVGSAELEANRQTRRFEVAHADEIVLI